MGAVLVAAQWQGPSVKPTAPEMSIALELAPMPVAEKSEPEAARATSEPEPAEQPQPKAEPLPQVKLKIPVPVPAPVPLVTPDVPLPALVVSASSSMVDTQATTGTNAGDATTSDRASSNTSQPSPRRQAHRHGAEDPAAAWRGRVRVRMTLDRQGHVLDVSVERGARFPPFNKEALATVQRADPLPPPPIEIEGSTIPLQVPIGFYLPRS